MIRRQALVLAVAVASVAAIDAALALDFRDAVSEAADDLAGVLAQRLKTDAEAAIIDFQDGVAGVRCQPPSGKSGVEIR